MDEVSDYFDDEDEAPCVLQKKEPLNWRKDDPLRFFQSLAFVLKSDLAVFAFETKSNETKLFLVANKYFKGEKKQITRILNMILDKKPFEEILKVVIRRHSRLFISKFRSLDEWDYSDFERNYPGREFVKVISGLHYAYRQTDCTFKEKEQLLDAIWNERNNLKRYSAEAYVNSASVKLLKVVRFIYELRRVTRRLEECPDIHKNLSRRFQFFSTTFHPEIALTQIAVEHCKSKELYLGLSNRPCIHCSIFVRNVNQQENLPFEIHLVPTNFKLYLDSWEIQGKFDHHYQGVMSEIESRLKEKQDQKMQKPRITDQ